MKTPTLSDAVIFSDDAQLAARLSCVLTMPGEYVPVIDGPRMQRLDRDAEVIRRANAAARARARRIFLAGLPDSSANALTQELPKRRRIRVDQTSDLVEHATNGAALDAPIVWGRDQIGVGTLKALRARRAIVFEDRPSDELYLPPKSNHLVVCEQGNELRQVIAANYAHALGAGLFLIQKTRRELVDQLLERFYSVYDSRDLSASEALRELGSELRDIAGNIPVPVNGSITFISDGLPFGFAFPEAPSTHLLA